MNNGSNNNKVWYTSGTLWLLFAQLIGEASLVLTGEMTILAAVALFLTTISVTIRRFYTDRGITLRKE